MSKLQQVTIPQSTFADLQHFLAESDSTPEHTFRLALATLLAPMIGHIRLFQTTEDNPCSVLEWSIGTETGAGDFGWEPVNLTTALKRVQGVIAGSSSPQDVRDVNLFLDLSVDPLDESLSIDINTESVLKGESLTELAAVSALEPPALTGEFDMPGDGLHLSAAEVASLLGVDKSTVTRRVRKDRLIGFRVFKNALRIPKEQFRDGDVVPGTAEVLALFKTETPNGISYSDHRAAWSFLTSTIYPGDVDPRPIDRLRAVSPGNSVSTVLAELALAKQSLDYGDHI